MIVTLEELPEILFGLRKANKTIGTTNGCFDLLHPGHIHSLTEAKRFVDYLIVGVSSDAVVRALKGLERPYETEADRAYKVDALHSVDYVVVLDDPNPTRFIRTVRPTHHFKGEEYKGKDIPEALGMKDRVIYLPRIPGYSTTELIARIRR